MQGRGMTEGAPWKHIIRFAFPHIRTVAFINIVLAMYIPLFGFGVGFTVTWIFYLSGKWAKNR